MRAVRIMDKEQKRRAGTVQAGSADSFTLSPTCPPSTSVHFRGGLAWRPAPLVNPAGFFIPEYTVDLTDSDKVSVRLGNDNYTYIFSNANWYVPCVFIIRGTLWPPPEPPDTWPDTVPDNAVCLYGGVGAPYMEEFETAAEAEDACRRIRGDAAFSYGVVAAGLVLRNNGNTISPNQYMPVDMVNRGRSYFFGKKRYGWELG